MSLLKTLLAATLLADPADALSAVKEALATQVLTIEDLATASESDLGSALVRQGAFASIWSVEDVLPRFRGTREEAQAWFDRNNYRLGDILGQRGNDALDDLLTGDGLYKEDAEDEDEVDEVEALVYGDAGHPSRTLDPGDIPALKAAGYTVNHKGEGWVFNDPDGNDDETAYTHMSVAWIAAKRDLATRPEDEG